MIKVTICVNQRCPLRHRCGKVFEPQEVQGTIAYKFFHPTRDQGGQVSCGEFSQKVSHGR
jgi:hypothetical protein